MRHRKAGRRLGRNASHRRALFRNLALALFRHERIITTVEKAKEVRPFVEHLITLAKKNTLHARRLVLSRLGTPSNAEVRPAVKKNDPDADPRTVLKKLFEEIGPRFKDRPGGYTRVIKRQQVRLGDAGKTAYLELLKEGETKARRAAPPPAPLPRVAEPSPPPPPTPAPEPAPEAPQAQTQPEAPPPEEQKAPENPPAQS